ncbi:MAG: PKD domain-containing protein [Bacteroidales bacterium]|nr:PKD domain-containing protein [Bacteroidales bacterium]
MEETREDKMLSDLFRQKLENAEISPSPALGSKLMHRVGRREFLRFNPSRFNIWYAGAAVAAAAALTAALLHSPEVSEDQNHQPKPLEISSPADLTSESSGTSIAEPGKGKPEPRKQPEVNKAAIPGRETSSTGGAGAGTAKPATTGETGKVSILPTAGIIREPDDANSKLKNNKPLAYIEASAEEGCAPLIISFRSPASENDSCAWHFGDEGRSAARNPVWTFNNEGEHRVTLEVYGPGGRSAASLTITVHPRPTARFEKADEDTEQAVEYISFRNFSDGAEKYRWSFGDGTGSDLFEPRHRYNKPGNYDVRLIAVSPEGCTDTVTTINVASSPGYHITFPNAFTPNLTGPSGGYYSRASDEASRIFHPVHNGVTEFHLTIFSKMGIMVFESNDINYGWDGYYKGQLCDPGVYVWKVRGKFINSDEFNKIGDVTLLNN